MSLLDQASAYVTLAMPKWAAVLAIAIIVTAIASAIVLAPRDYGMPPRDPDEERESPR